MSDIKRDVRTTGSICCRWGCKNSYFELNLFPAARNRVAHSNSRLWFRGSMINISATDTDQVFFVEFNTFLIMYRHL
jgi:hypothetical protein